MSNNLTLNAAIYNLKLLKNLFPTLLLFILFFTPRSQCQETIIVDVDVFMLLSKSGMTNIDILKSGTSNIYEAFGLSEFSKLGKNKLANFVLVKGKPHVNLVDIYNEKRIWKLGKALI